MRASSLGPRTGSPLPRGRAENWRSHMTDDLPACETLKLTIERGILHVTLDRPETKNALNRAMVRDLTAVVDYLAAHQDIRAAVVRGANATFCSGGDINGFKELFSTPPPAAGERDGAALHNRRFGAIMSRFEELPQTIVMVVEGAAFGGGLVDMACDGTAALDAALAQVLAGIVRCSPHANAVTKGLILASRKMPRE